MSNLHARTIAPGAVESGSVQEKPLQPARAADAAATADAYGNTFGLPFAVWWTIVLTVLVALGLFAETQIAR